MFSLCALIRSMKFLLTFLLLSSLAAAYIPSPDRVLIDGRLLLTDSRPLETFPWVGQKPQLSEFPSDRSDSREVDALWEINEGHLYLVAVSAFKSGEFAPHRSLGLRDLMPERIRDGKVRAEWFTGEFRILEMERVDPRLSLRPEQAPPMRTVVRTVRVEKGRVTEPPPPPAEPAR